MEKEKWILISSLSAAEREEKKVEVDKKDHLHHPAFKGAILGAIVQLIRMNFVFNELMGFYYEVLSDQLI